MQIELPAGVERRGCGALVFQESFFLKAGTSRRLGALAWAGVVSPERRPTTAARARKESIGTGPPQGDGAKVIMDQSEPAGGGLIICPLGTASLRSPRPPHPPHSI